MEALRVGGIISGLDTNAIIEALMIDARAPIVRLNQKMGILSIEKQAYNSVISSITDLKDSLFPLRLESTFKSKTSSLSNSNIASVTASVDAVAGNYFLDVKQLASNSFATTYIPKPFIYPGANVGKVKISGDAFDNQLMGVHTVDIGTVATVTSPPVDIAMATDTFVASDGRDFEKFLAGAMTSVNSFGGFPATATTPTINGTNITFKIEVDGVEKEIQVDFAGYGTTSTSNQVQMVAKDIEDQLNAGLGAEQYDQKIAVKTEYDLTTQQFKLVFYNTDSEPMDIDIVGGTASTINGLGLATPPITTPPTPTTPISLTSSGRVSEMINQVVGRDMDHLTNKISYDKGGIIPGLELALATDATSVKKGSFTINYEDTMNRKIATKSQFLGNNFRRIETDNPIQRDIDKWLSTSFKTSDTGNDSYFDEPAVAGDLNGYFHINNVKITIDAIDNLTPNSLMAIINSSGAGVTASWDYENNFFRIENNATGGEDVTLGKDGDTSDILNFLNVDIPSGAIYIRGNDEGTIDTSAKVNVAGFSTAVGAPRGVFSINGVSIYIDTSKDTVADIMKKVNSSAANVKMSYDKNTDKFRLDSTDGIGQIQVGSSTDTSNFLEMIGVSNDFDVPSSIGTAGQKSIFSIDGIKYERETNKVNGLLTGVDITLTDTGTTTINIEVDTDRAIDAMAKFASSYNKLMILTSPDPIPYNDDERKKYWEPLSEEKANQMNEDDIKTYNEKHTAMRMSETILRSSEIQNIKRHLRTTLMDNTTTSGLINNITDFGLDIAGSGDITLTSKGLFIDTTTDVDKIKTMITDSGQFATMIKENPDEVFTFFVGNVKSSSGEVLENGWSNRYDSWATSNSNTSSVLYKKAGVNGTIDAALSRYQQDISTQTKRAEQYLERMWAQFTAMEVRMGQIQEQSNALAQMSASSQ